MVIKIYKHFINKKLTFRTLKLISIYKKLKLIKYIDLMTKYLLTCFILLIKRLFYNTNFKI